MKLAATECNAAKVLGQEIDIADLYPGKVEMGLKFTYMVELQGILHQHGQQ